MDLVTLSRLQFALTTVYHWLFVPLTLGMGWFVAFMQTRYYQTKDETWHKMAKFWGKLFLINFAIGDRKSTRLNSSHIQKSRMPSSA